MISSAVPGNNCPTGGTDPACTATTTILIPALTVLKTADRATTVPGGTVGYTITVTNVGETAYTGATVADSLAGLLDDATYNGDASASSGVVSYGAPILTWTGDLAIDGSVTITYTVTADDPQTGGRVLVNTVSSTTAGSNCPPGGSDPDCSVTVQVAAGAEHQQERQRRHHHTGWHGGLHHHRHQQRPDRLHRGHPERQPRRRARRRHLQQRRVRHRRRGVVRRADPDLDR
ncbi:hypothetical protein NKG94_01545 [Micromonospora sp. M12]